MQNRIKKFLEDNKDVQYYAVLALALTGVFGGWKLLYRVIYGHGDSGKWWRVRVYICKECFSSSILCIVFSHRVMSCSSF